MFCGSILLVCREHSAVTKNGQSGILNYTVSTNMSSAVMFSVSDQTLAA